MAELSPVDGDPFAAPVAGDPFAAKPAPVAGDPFAPVAGDPFAKESAPAHFPSNVSVPIEGQVGDSVPMFPAKPGEVKSDPFATPAPSDHPVADALHKVNEVLGYPQAFLARIYSGERLSKMHDVVEHAFKDSFGTVGFEPNSTMTKAMEDSGLFNVPGQPVSTMRMLNEAIARPAAKVADALLKVIPATSAAISAGIGQTAEDTGIVKEGGGEKLAGEIDLMANLAMLAFQGGGMPHPMKGNSLKADIELRLRNGEGVTRPITMPDGSVIDQHIGTPPKPEDFDNTARIIAGDTAPDHVYDKLDKLWEEHGIHPSEVAHDAQSNPTITQSIVNPSTSLPAAYTGIPEALPDVRRIARGTSPEARAIWDETSHETIDEIEKAILDKQGPPITNEEIIKTVGGDLDEKTVDAVKEGLGVPTDAAEHVKWRIRVGGDGTRDLYDELGINSSSANRAHAGKNAIYTPATAMEINNAQETHTPGWSTFIMKGKGGDRVVRVLRDSSGRQIHHTVFSLDENGKAMPDTSHLYTDIDHTGNGYTAQAVKALDSEGYGATDAIAKTTSGTNEMSRGTMDKIMTDSRIVKDDLTGHNVDLNKTEEAMNAHVNDPNNKIPFEQDMAAHFNRTNPNITIKTIKDMGMDTTDYIPKTDAEIYPRSGPLIPEGYKVVRDPETRQLKVRKMHEGEKAYYEAGEINPHDPLDPNNLKAMEDANLNPSPENAARLEGSHPLIAEAKKIDEASTSKDPGWSDVHYAVDPKLPPKWYSRTPVNMYARVLRDEEGRIIHFTAAAVDENRKFIPNSFKTYTDVDHAGNGYVGQSLKTLDKKGFEATKASRETTQGRSESAKIAMAKHFEKVDAKSVDAKDMSAYQRTLDREKKLTEDHAKADATAKAKLADLEKRIAEEKATPEGLGSPAHREKVRAKFEEERAKIIEDRDRERHWIESDLASVREERNQIHDNYFSRNPNPAEEWWKTPATEAEAAAAQEKVSSKISVGEEDPKERYSLHRLYTDFVDRLFPVTKAVKEAKAMNESALTNPAKLVRLLQGGAGRATHFLERATFDFKTYKNNGKSLKEILAPHKGDEDGLRAYLTARRAYDMHNKLWTAETALKEARAERSTAKWQATPGSGAGSTGKAASESELKALEAKVTRAKAAFEEHNRSGIDMADAKMTIKAGHAKYGKTMDEIIAFQDRVAQYLRDSGVLSKDAYKAIKEGNKHFVPFHRVAEEGVTPKRPTMMERLRGEKARDMSPEAAERKIVDPLESIIKNTHTFMEMANKNEVNLSMIDLLKRTEGAKKIAVSTNAELSNKVGETLEQSGLAADKSLVEALTPERKDVRDGTVTAFRGGVKESYKVDKELARALSGQNKETMNTIMRVLALPANAMRAGATITPEFMMRHLMRDAQYTFLSSKGASEVMRMGEGIIGQIVKDENYWQWVKGGGSNISMFSLERRYMSENLRELTGQNGVAHKVWNVVNPRLWTERAENASHVGVFKSAIEDELKGTLTHPDEAGKEAILNAAFQSRSTGVDAARMGAKMQAWNLITAFANITIQDTDRVLRAFKDRPVVTTIKATAGIALPSMLLWYANHNDPRYAEIPQWQKDTFWIWMFDKWEDQGEAVHGDDLRPDQRIVNGRLQQNNGAIMRLPKPFGAGVIMGGGVERAMEAVFGSDEHAFKGLGESVMDTTIPAIIPTAAVPLIEQFANRSLFSKQALVPSSLEKLLPEYQYTASTTELGKQLSQWIAAVPGVRDASLEDKSFIGGTSRALSSPALLENYIRAYSGATGENILHATDFALRKAGLLPDPPKAPMTLADYPIIKAFIARFPGSSARSIQDFNDEYEKNKVPFDTWRAMAQAGDADASQRIQDANGEDMFVQLDAIKQAITTQQQAIQNIAKLPPEDMPDDEKRQNIDGLYYAMIMLSKDGLEAMKTMKEKNP